MKFGPRSAQRERWASGGADAYGMHRWAMPIEPVSVDLTRYDHVTICSPIWVFALAAPVRSFCQQASVKIKEVDYILVHHQNSRYENAAQEMDALLGIDHMVDHHQNNRHPADVIQIQLSCRGHDIPTFAMIFNTV